VSREPRAGDLNRRVTIEAPRVARDAVGGRAETWEAVATVWGALRGVSGREAYIAAASRATGTHVLTIRYRTDVRASMRARVDGVVYNFTRPPSDPTGRRAWLEILAEVKE
jgi:SPP1 family predicted phage head-tail adaptor